MAPHFATPSDLSTADTVERATIEIGYMPSGCRCWLRVLDRAGAVVATCGDYPSPAFARRVAAEQGLAVRGNPVNDRDCSPHYGRGYDRLGQPD